MVTYRIQNPKEPKEDGFGGTYIRYVQSVEEAQEVAKELVAKHYPPPHDPLNEHLPLCYQALIFIGQEEGKPQAGEKVAFVSTLERLRDEVRLFEVGKVGTDDDGWFIEMTEAIGGLFLADIEGVEMPAVLRKSMM